MYDFLVKNEKKNVIVWIFWPNYFFLQLQEETYFQKVDGHIVFVYFDIWVNSKYAVENVKNYKNLNDSYI